MNILIRVVTSLAKKDFRSYRETKVVETTLCELSINYEKERQG